MITNGLLGFLTAIFALIWCFPVILNPAWFPRWTSQGIPDEDVSLLQLAEAFAKRLERERAQIAERINDPETIRDLLAIESVISPAHHAFLEMLNPIRPAHRLPREMLIQIFALVGSGKTILPVSHVCRRWRDIALKTPELWFSFEPDDFTPMMPVAVQRSGDHLLDVSLHTNCDEIRRLERLLELPFSRLRSLDVAVTDELYPALRSVPNLETLALLNTISVLSENFSGSDTPIALDRLRVLYIHQPRGALKHLNHLFTHLTIPRLDLACVFMSDSAVIDDDIPESPENSYRMFRTVTELVMHLDSLPESQFYLYGVHEDNLAFSLCLPTATMPRIFHASGLSMGTISANISQVTRFISWKPSS
ncbi:hypothetical protein BJV74DRAFT_796264 [Russula compacta]|nr:hypothetical protein BJV74DRAFT_796264 [Russula compacta]